MAGHTGDFFSGHSEIYAAFRPTYPEALYEFVLSHTRGRSAAWDCATGNGQVARDLSHRFEKVYATDISAGQIAQAAPGENIIYAVSPAESTPFPGAQFDLVTVAQAIHWINTREFYREAVRVSKPHALLAVWGYGLLKIGPEIDGLLHDFYHRTVGPYWDRARKHVEEGYRNIPFPFDQINAPPFEIKLKWTVGHFAGYLTSWSATQKFLQANGTDPVAPFIQSLLPLWDPSEARQVTFPIFMKLGKIR